MKLAMRYVTLFCLAMISVSGFAETKIAVVDQLAAIMESDPAKNMIDDIKADLEKEQAKIMALEEEIKGLMEKQEKDSAVMSGSENRKLMKEIEDKKIDYNFLGKKFQKKQKEGQQEIVNAVGPKFKKALKDVMEKGEYDVILQRQAAIIFSPDIDITQEITKRINAQQ